MNDLHRFFKDPFDDPSIGIDRLLTYTTDHLARLIANNTLADVTARITATTTALAGVEGSFNDDQTQGALRKARNKLKDDYRLALLAGVEKVYAAIVAKVGSKSAVVTECFPDGRAVFNKCKDDHVESSLQMVINGATAHATELTAQVATDATALLTGWKAVYGTSETTAGLKSSSIVDKKTARANLQLELFKNVLTLALAFPRQPEMCDVFMQQSLLETHPQSTTTPPTPTPTATK